MAGGKQQCVQFCMHRGTHRPVLFSSLTDAFPQPTFAAWRHTRCWRTIPRCYDTPVDSDAVNFVRRLTGGNSTGKISFGTEGGLFTRDLGVPAVVCGPGSIAVAHKPDEYISRDQLKQCDAMLGRLVDALAA